MLPIFSDGEKHTDIRVEDGEITVEYLGSRCIFCFNGIAREEEAYYNRNGEYKVFCLDSDALHIEII